MRMRSHADANTGLAAPVWSTISGRRRRPRAGHLAARGKGGQCIVGELRAARRSTTTTLRRVFRSTASSGRAAWSTFADQSPDASDDHRRRRRALAQRIGESTRRDGVLDVDGEHERDGRRRPGGWFASRPFAILVGGGAARVNAAEERSELAAKRNSAILAANAPSRRGLRSASTRRRPARMSSVGGPRRRQPAPGQRCTHGARSFGRRREPFFQERTFRQGPPRACAAPVPSPSTTDRDERGRNGRAVNAPPRPAETPQRIHRARDTQRIRELSRDIRQRQPLRRGDVQRFAQHAYLVVVFERDDRKIPA